MRSLRGIAVVAILPMWATMTAVLVLAFHGWPVLQARAAHSTPPAVRQAAIHAPIALHSVDPRVRQGRLDPARPLNVYAAISKHHVLARLSRIPERVYVPNSGDGTVTVIDPRTYQIVDRFMVGDIPHHIAPSWDLTHLYVDNEGSSSLTVIDPYSGKPVSTIPVPFPYNLYFTPDGSKAIVVVERLGQLDFRNPQNWQLIKSVDIPWAGIDHLDFSADGRYLLGTCEWTGVVVKVDTVAMKLVGSANVGGLPVDIKLSPDGKVFYVANQGRSGVSIVDPVSMQEIGFIPTGEGAHGMAVSRDTRFLYVSNRLAGTISVISFQSRRVVATWNVGGTPDMLEVSPDGRQLWFSGRYDGTVDVLDTRSGQVIHTISTGFEPHGLTFFPNVGRYSIGHNGVYR